MADVKDYSADALLRAEKQVELDTDDVKEENVEIKEEVKDILSTKHKQFGFPIEGRLSVDIRLHPPNRRKFDIDNRIKPLLDAMAVPFGCAYDDDEAIDRLLITRHDIIKGGLAIVTIKQNVVVDSVE